MTSKLLFSILISLTIFTHKFCNGVTLNQVNHKNFSNYPFDIKLYEDVLNPELCQRQLSTMKVNNTGLMLRFLDASARIPKAILLGNNLDLGSYHQCLNIREYVDDMNVQGKYCMAHVSLNENMMNFLDWPIVDLDKDSFNQFSVFERIDKRLRETFGIQSHDTRISYDSSPLSNINLRLAICIPESCTPREAVDVLFFNLTNYNLNVEEQFCRLPNDKPWVPSDYIAIIIFSTILLLVILSTCYDVWYSIIQKKDTNEIKTIYSCFSVYTNTRRLVTFKPGADPLYCIDGIRALAMLWVVVGHTSLSVFSSANILEAFQWATSPRALWVTSATITVDTFFVLSGLLIVYSTAGKLTSMQLLKNIHLFYLNRLLRMFPILAAMILYEASFLNRVFDGPKWNDMVGPILNCRQYWWSALLHIQNIYNPSRMCISVSWYLSVDVQLHLLSPIILVWVLSGKKNIAWTALMAGFLTTIVAASIYNFINDFKSGFFAQNMDDLQRYNAYYYSNTLTRASPFFVGMIFGYILHIWKGKNPQIPKAIILTTWSLASLVLAGVIYCVPLSLRDGWDNQLVDNLINSYMRPAWALGLGWLIFACVKGYGGPINWFLSLSIWKLPARLSYAVYLIHFTLILAVNSSSNVQPYFSIPNLIFDTTAFLFITTIIAFVVTVTIDAPFSTLTKHLLTKDKRETNIADMKNGMQVHKKQDEI